MSKACCDAGTSGLKLLDSIDTRGNVTGDLDLTIQQVQRVLSLAEALVPKMEDVKVEEIGDLVDTEMHSTTAAVEAAAAKMEVSIL